MSGHEQTGRLMDAAAIMAELGVTRAQASRIIRWCNDRGGVVKPVDGARKLYVYRESVELWVRESTRTEAA